MIISNTIDDRVVSKRHRKNIYLSSISMYVWVCVYSTVIKKINILYIVLFLVFIETSFYYAVMAGLELIRIFWFLLPMC